MDGGPGLSARWGCPLPSRRFPRTPALPQSVCGLLEAVPTLTSPGRRAGPKGSTGRGRGRRGSSPRGCPAARRCGSLRWSAARRGKLETRGLVSAARRPSCAPRHPPQKPVPHNVRLGPLYPPPAPAARWLGLPTPVLGSAWLCHSTPSTVKTLGLILSDHQGVVSKVIGET